MTGADMWCGEGQGLAYIMQVLAPVLLLLLLSGAILPGLPGLAGVRSCRGWRQIRA